MAVEELSDHQIGVLKKRKRASSKRVSKRGSKVRESSKSASKQSSGNKSTPSDAAAVAKEANEENPVLKAMTNMWAQVTAVDWKGHVDEVVKSLSAKNKN
jgi:hypothetical protein